MYIETFTATHKSKTGKRSTKEITVTTTVKTVEIDGKTYIPTGEVCDYSVGGGTATWTISEFRSIPTGERNFKPESIWANDVFTFIVDSPK